MTNFTTSRLAKLLALLSIEECKSFTKWLDSPWCNNNRLLPLFFRLLLPFYPAFDQPRCHKAALFKKLYPQQEYRPKPMRRIMSELSKQVEQFLIQQQLQKEPI